MHLPRLFYPTGYQWIRSRRKRTSDLIICLSITPFAIIIYLCSLALILLFQKHPPFFSQVRIGRDGQLFTIHKLQTWNHDGKTNLGELLNVLGADETPQILYDIWRGKMGVIGARPLVPGDFLRMHEVLGERKYQLWYSAYISCHPGWMSAFSQRSRLHPGQSQEYLYTRYRWETWYLDNACWHVDIQIFLRSLTMWCTDPARLLTAIATFIRHPRQ